MRPQRSRWRRCSKSIRLAGVLEVSPDHTRQVRPTTRERPTRPTACAWCYSTHAQAVESMFSAQWNGETVSSTSHPTLYRTLVPEGSHDCCPESNLSRSAIRCGWLCRPADCNRRSSLRPQTIASSDARKWCSRARRFSTPIDTRTRPGVMPLAHHAPKIAGFRKRGHVSASCGGSWALLHDHASLFRTPVLLAADPQTNSAFLYCLALAARALGSDVGVQAWAARVAARRIRPATSATNHRRRARGRSRARADGQTNRWEAWRSRSALG